MLNIYFPEAPRIEEFGLTDEEIHRIEVYKIKPLKKGNREDVLQVLSMALYYIVFVAILLIAFINNPNNKLSLLSTILLCLVLPLLYSLTLIIPWIGVGISQFFLNLVIPQSILPDKDIYDEKTLKIIDNKKKLEQYHQAVKQHENDIERINKEYPMADGVFPVGMKDNDTRYPQLFRAYIQKVIKESFLPSLKDDIVIADKLEEKRASLEWWETLNPFDFEKEVGKWYQKKGYHVNVTNKSNDGGVDVVLTMNGETTYVQCKQWNYQVPVGVVRELYGVMASHGVKKGIVVCLNGGTKGAVDFANDNGIRIVTHHDFVKETKPIDKTYTSKDIGNYWQYGNYFILYDAWKNVEDAINTINKTNYTSRNFVVGLCKWESFYLGVAINKTINHALSCFEYIIDAEKGKIIFEKPRRVFPSSNSYRPYKKKRKRGGWYGSRW